MRLLLDDNPSPRLAQALAESFDDAVLMGNCTSRDIIDLLRTNSPRIERFINRDMERVLLLTKASTS